MTECNAGNWREVLEQECEIPAAGWSAEANGSWHELGWSLEWEGAGLTTVTLDPCCASSLYVCHVGWHRLPLEVKAIQAGARARAAVLAFGDCVVTPALPVDPDIDAAVNQLVNERTRSMGSTPIEP